MSTIQDEERSGKKVAISSLTPSRPSKQFRPRGNEELASSLSLSSFPSSSLLVGIHDSGAPKIIHPQVARSQLFPILVRVNAPALLPSSLPSLAVVLV